jgi:uncharacterized iron-regulated protein
MKDDRLDPSRKCPESCDRGLAPRVHLGEPHRSRGLPPPWARCGAFLFVALIACTKQKPVEAPKPAPPAAIKSNIYAPARHAFITRAELDAALLAANYVLLGERHDHPEHHRLQREMLSVVLANKPALVMEMIDVDAQEKIGTDPNLSSIAPGWDWPMYQPIVELAMKNNLKVLAGNYPRAKIKATFHGTPIPDEDRTALGLNIPLPHQSELENDLFESHCGKVPKEHLAPMVEAQRLRDGQMAERMLTEKYAVLIAGNGHTRTDRGVPWVIRVRDKNARVFSLAFLEEGASSLETQPYDAVWITPRLVGKEHEC